MSLSWRAPSMGRPVPLDMDSDNGIFEDFHNHALYVKNDNNKTHDPKNTALFCKFQYNWYTNWLDGNILKMNIFSS